MENSSLLLCMNQLLDLADKQYLLNLFKGVFNGINFHSVVNYMGRIGKMRLWHMFSAFPFFSSKAGQKKWKHKNRSGDWKLLQIEHTTEYIGWNPYVVYFQEFKKSE